MFIVVIPEPSRSRHEARAPGISIDSVLLKFTLYYCYMRLYDYSRIVNQEEFDGLYILSVFRI